jgi:hypothetical protein
VPRREGGVVGDEEAALKTARSIFSIGRGSASAQHGEGVRGRGGKHVQVGMREHTAAHHWEQLSHHCLVVCHIGARTRPVIRARGGGGA